MQNAMSLNVEVTLDRKDYLAGEALTVTLRVKNATAKPLIVPEPFLHSTQPLRTITLQHRVFRFAAPQAHPVGRHTV